MMSLFWSTRQKVVSIRLKTSITLFLLAWSQLSVGQSAVLDEPIRVFTGPVSGEDRPLPLPKPTRDELDVLDYAEKTFSKKYDGSIESLNSLIEDPRARGNLRGRIAEGDWIHRNSGSGWEAAENAIDPEIDAVRRVNGVVVETAQVKTHINPKNYIDSLLKDSAADIFVVPDDQYDLVYNDLEERRIGALRGRERYAQAGLVDKAEEQAAKAARYTRDQARLRKMGRKLSDFETAINLTAKHGAKVSRALATSGKVFNYVAIAFTLLQGAIVVKELANGEAEVGELVEEVGVGIAAYAASQAAWYAAAQLAAAAGATGNVPAAVAIVVGTAAYLVVDWGLRELVEQNTVAYLSVADINRLFPEGLRGISLEGLEGGISLEGLHGGISLEGLEGGISLEGL